MFAASRGVIRGFIQRLLMGHPLSTGHWPGTGGGCGVNKTGRGLAPLAPPSSLSLPQGFGLRRPVLLPSINALSGEPAFGSQFTSGQIQSPRGVCVCVCVFMCMCIKVCAYTNIVEKGAFS